MKNTIDSIDGLTVLTDNELKETNGGIFGVILLAGEIYAGVCLLAYATGYAVGRIEKALK
jgi:hypothetical protein